MKVEFGLMMDRWVIVLEKDSDEGGDGKGSGSVGVCSDRWVRKKKKKILVSSYFWLFC